MNKEERSNIRLLASLLILSASLLILSCGVPEPDAKPGSGQGKVVLFITDNISFYNQVVVTVTGVRLVESGTGEVCEVLNSPVTLDVANLTDIAQYVGLAACPAGRYNRIDVDFKKAVHLMDQLNNPSACVFSSFIDYAGSVQPLACDQDTGICTMSVRGGLPDGSILVQEDRYNDLGIDFNLKEFTVADFGNPSTCSITMAGAIQSASAMNESGRAHSITGGVTGLDRAAQTFTLTTSSGSLTVDYSPIIPALQPDVGALMQAAQDGGFTVNVRTGGIDLAAGTISANRLYLKAAGTVSNVMNQPEWTFTLSDGSAWTIAGSHGPPADIQGVFADGVWADIKFSGYDDHDGRFLAGSIEVLPPDTVLAD